MSRANVLWILMFSVPAAAAPAAEPDQDQGAKRVITYTAAPDHAAVLAAARNARMVFYDYPLGKSFWFKPGKHYWGAGFFQKVERSSGVVSYGSLEGKFVPNVPVRFTVRERVELDPPNDGETMRYAFLVDIEDGTEAYVRGWAFGTFDPMAPFRTVSRPLSNDPSAAADPPRDVLFTEDPEPLAAKHASETALKERQQREAQAKAGARARAAERAHMSRGGVKLGMTAQQVKGSAWGAPLRVNRTTSGAGAHEQWVYGDGNYLYFNNGVLITIQN